VSESILNALAVGGQQELLNKLCVLRAFKEALDAHPYEVDPVIDFFDFCRKLLVQKPLDAAVRTEARKVLDKGYRSFVVHDARSGPKIAALNGLSILAPDFDDPKWLQTRRSAASNNKAYLWSQTRWAAVTEKVYEFDQSRKAPSPSAGAAAPGK
jgi:hypothetical protein